MNELTAFQRDILYIVQYQTDPNGLEIKTAIEAYYEKEVNHGRLYPNLDTLTDAELIDKGAYDKRTNKYELTDYGQEVLQTRLRWEQERAGDLLE